MLGSPIEHSRSPALHAAAYRVLELDWDYDRAEVDTAALPAFIAGLGDEWRGLSLTMPLKRDVLPLLDDADELVTLTGAANTLVLTDGRRRGANTDVYGIVRALTDGGVETVESVHLLGGGATAASALVAVRRLGAERATLAVRSADRAREALDLARRIGLPTEVVALDAAPGPVDLVVSTLPGPAAAGLQVAAGDGIPLFDVAYDPWPSPLGSRWTGPVISGLEMLLHQAVGQIRLFLTGSADEPLPREAEVVEAMRTAVGLP